MLRVTLFTSLLFASGCLLPDYQANGSGGTGAGGGNGGGAGGAGGGGSAPLICPDKFAFSLGGDIADGTKVAKGIVLPETGQTIVAGTFEETINFVYQGDATPFTAGETNLFVGGIDAQGHGVWIQTIHAPTSGLTIERIVPLGKDGVILLFQSSRNVTIAGEQHEVATIDQPDAFAARFDTAGALSWVKQVEGSGESTLSAGVRVGDEVLFMGHFKGELMLANDSADTLGDKWPFIVGVDIESGAETRAKHYSGSKDADLRDVVVRGDKLYLVGDFQQAFPNFGLPSQPAASNSDSIFWMRMDATTLGAEAAVGYGANTRSDHSVAIVDTGDGFVLFGRSAAASDLLATTFDFGGLDTSGESLPGPLAASFIGKIDDEGGGLWFRRTPLTIGEFTHSAVVDGGKQGGGYALGHQHLPSSGGVVGTELENATLSTPEVDSLFMHFGPDGERDGVLAFGGLPQPGQVSTFDRSHSPCGDLIFGSFRGTIVYGDTTFPATGRRGFVAFEPGGLVFDAPP